MALCELQVHWSYGRTFGPENRLLQWGNVLACGYNGGGQRAWKQNSAGARTYFVYDGSEPVCELNGSGTLIAVNDFGADGVWTRHTDAETGLVLGTHRYYDPAAGMLFVNKVPEAHGCATCRKQDLRVYHLLLIMTDPLCRRRVKAARRRWPRAACANQRRNNFFRRWYVCATP